MSKAVPAGWAPRKPGQIDPISLEGLGIEPTGPTLADAQRGLDRTVRQGEAAGYSFVNPQSLMDGGAPAPMPVAPPPRDMYDPAAVRPVPTQTLDGKQWLRTMVSSAMRAVPGESAKDMSLRISRKADFEKQVESLGDMSLDEAMATWQGWYSQVQPPAESEFSSFSPDAQFALAQAFAPSSGRRIATAADVDPNEALALAAYGVAGMLTGRGDFGAVLRSVPQLMGRAQRRVDAEDERRLQNEELARKGALARFERISTVDDANAKQRGYEAHDLRLTDRNLQNQMLRDAAAASDDQRSMQLKFGERYFDFLRSGDSDRAEAVKRFYETTTGQKLDDSFSALAKTSSEELTDANAAAARANIDRTKAIVKGLNLKNEFDSKSMENRLVIIANNRKLGARNLEKLEEELKHLPEKLKADVAVKWSQWYENVAQADAAVTRAEAAMKNANKPSSSGDKDELSNLRTMVNGFNSSIDNKAQRYARVQAVIADLEDQKVRANVFDKKDMNAPRADLDAMIKARRDELKSLEDQMEAERKTVDEALKKLKGVAGIELGDGK